MLSTNMLNVFANITANVNNNYKCFPKYSLKIIIIQLLFLNKNIIINKGTVKFTKAGLGSSKSDINLGLILDILLV